MTNPTFANPAEVEAEKALQQVFECIDQGQSFVFEAGAGAGKTYSLNACLQKLLAQKGAEFRRNNQRIACITYTNAAKDDLRSRTSEDEVIYAETIHSFCWSMIKDFQPQIRNLLPSIGKWSEKIDEEHQIGSKPVVYSLGYPKIGPDEVTLHHDDVILLMVKFMEEPKFRAILARKFPIIFIDEYQDTNKLFADSLKCFLEDEVENGPLLGFFGDHWQRIYDTKTCGRIEHHRLVEIGKQANFRSEKAIVESLNRMRPDLQQAIKNPDSLGSVQVFHTNEWLGARQTNQHWKGDLPPEVAHNYLNKVKEILSAQEWDFHDPKATKTLMLTHNVLANEQGYRNLLNVFKNNDTLMQKDDPHFAFFADLIEPLCEAYADRNYGKMFTILDGRTPKIEKHRDKVAWKQAMDELTLIRSTGTVGEVLECIQRIERPRIPADVEVLEQEYAKVLSDPPEQMEERAKERFERITALKKVKYSEVTRLARFLNKETPFATKHSVKGLQFENVLVVCGRGWNRYDFDEMLRMVNDTQLRDSKLDFFERNRNLFYVACSRPTKRLAILFTQFLSGPAQDALKEWFGENSVYALPRL